MLMTLAGAIRRRGWSLRLWHGVLAAAPLLIITSRAFAQDGTAFADLSDPDTFKGWYHNFCAADSVIVDVYAQIAAWVGGGLGGSTAVAAATIWIRRKLASKALAVVEGAVVAAVAPQGQVKP